MLFSATETVSDKRYKPTFERFIEWSACLIHMFQKFDGTHDVAQRMFMSMTHSSILQLKNLNDITAVQQI